MGIINVLAGKTPADVIDSEELVVSGTVWIVTFMDYDNVTILKTESVLEGGTAHPPSDPDNKTGWHFTSWTGIYTGVTANVTITAFYTIDTYTITFRNWDETLLKTADVTYLGSTTPPVTNPTRTYYDFDGTWSGVSYTSATQSGNVYPDYTVLLSSYSISLTTPVVFGETSNLSVVKIDPDIPDVADYIWTATLFTVANYTLYNADTHIASIENTNQDTIDDIGYINCSITTTDGQSGALNNEPLTLAFDNSVTAPTFFENTAITGVSASVGYTNNDTETADITINIIGEFEDQTETVVGVLSGAVGYVSFYSLDYGEGYATTAIASVVGRPDSIPGGTGTGFQTLSQTNTPSTPTTSLITHEGFTVTAYNSDTVGDLYISIDGGAPVSTPILGTNSASILFDTLDPSTTYSIVAYIIADGKAQSQNTLPVNETTLSIVVTQPSISFVSKTNTTIVWRYTNLDGMAAHIWAKLDSGAYVDLGEVDETGGITVTVDKSWTVNPNTTHNTSAYAAVVGRTNSTPDVVSANQTTPYTFVDLNVSFDSDTETEMVISIENPSDVSVIVHWVAQTGSFNTLPDEFDEAPFTLAANTTILKTFSGLTHFTLYYCSARSLYNSIYSTYAGISNITDQRLTATPTITGPFDITDLSLSYDVVSGDADAITIWGKLGVSPYVNFVEMTPIGNRVTFSALAPSTSYTPTFQTVTTGEATSIDVSGAQGTTGSMAVPRLVQTIQEVTELAWEIHNDNPYSVTLEYDDNVAPLLNSIPLGASPSNSTYAFAGLDPLTTVDIYARFLKNGGVTLVSTASATTDQYQTVKPQWSSNDSVSYTTARVYYTNMDGQAATIYITVNGVEKNTGSILAGQTGFCDFTGLTHNTPYTSTARAQASGELMSETSTVNGPGFTTLQYQTETPNWASNTSIGETSAIVSYYNPDTSSVIISISLYQGTTLIETKDTLSVAYDSIKGVTFSGLTDGTTYTSRATAKATDESDSTVYRNDTLTDFTTLVIPQTSAPNWVSNTLITASTVRVTYYNTDASTATIYITVNGVENSVSVASDGTGYCNFSGLASNTTYTPTARAQASGETMSELAPVATSFTTLQSTYTASFTGLVGATPTSYTSQTINEGSSATSPGSPTKTGYNFTGWSPAFVALYADQVYTAQFTAQTYTITFDSNTGDTPSPTSKTVTYDSTYGTLATVSKTGWTFNGWFTAASGGTQITSGTTVSIIGNDTLYAQWTEDPPAVNTWVYLGTSGTYDVSLSRTVDVCKFATSSAAYTELEAQSPASTHAVGYKGRVGYSDTATPIPNDCGSFYFEVQLV